MIESFLTLSIDLTGFTRFALQSTGMSEDYLNAALKVVGTTILGEMLTRYQSIPAAPADLRAAEIQRQILGDDKFGPIARNIIKMWYIGIWEALPLPWIERYGPLIDNTGFMVSGMAYREGLLWLAIGANPPGAKGPGYGSWALPPKYWEPPTSH
jgi:hypothetical protein